MSQPDNNICKICGGAIRIEYTLTLEECRPYQMRVSDLSSLPTGPDWLCRGHHKPENPHDGRLVDGIHIATAKIDPSSGYLSIEETGVRVVLSPVQALSLRAYLEENAEDIVRWAEVVVISRKGEEDGK